MSSSEVKIASMEQPPVRQNQKTNLPDAHWREDEISLVDLTIILIRRWKAIVIIFSLVVALAIVFALTQATRYEYTSLYSVAEYTNENGNRVGVESPESVVAKAKSLYLGQEVRGLLEDHGLDSLPFEVDIINPDETLFLQLSSETSGDNYKLVNELHLLLIDRLRDDQKQLVQRQHDLLESQLASAREALDSARESDSNSAAELMATLYKRISDIESKLDGLREGEITQHAAPGLNSKGVGKKFVIFIGFVIGCMLAILGALLLEFWSVVYNKIRRTEV